MPSHIYLIVAAVVLTLLVRVAIRGREIRRQARSEIFPIPPWEDVVDFARILAERGHRFDAISAGISRVYDVDIAAADCRTLAEYLDLVRQLAPRLPAAPPSFDWPAKWRLFSFILPKRTRDRAFEPLFNELVDDFLECRRYKRPWERRWIAISFTVRTALMILECLRVAALDVLRDSIPEEMRRRWRLW